ncbi:lipid II:glycine glycyltransferase FemX [Actinomyces sp. W5033]|uniref:lipid II:glycine glycyltransferase FemX n=1 Tax=Actinomyces sp. W5033 TaxID=3446479 RepID=UPI003EE067C5
MPQTFRPVTDEDYARLIAGSPYPHRASVEWDDYAALLPERAIWRGSRLAYLPDGAARPRAVITLRQFHIHAMPFLWAEGGPVWVGQEPSAEEETAFAAALGQLVRSEDHAQAFVRFDVLHHEDVLGTVPACQELYAHDTTVVIDTTGTEDDLRARMKKRGRRDVNKAQRECPAVIAEETTTIDRAGFDELIAVMALTSERQGFSAHDAEHYWTFFTTFRDKGMARLFVGREDGRPVNWGLFIVRGDFATYEVAASTEEARRTGAPDLMLYTGLITLQADGVSAVDLVAVGSDYNPTLNTLNRFKTKWTTQTTRVPAPVEVVLKPLRYRVLTWLAARRP